MSKEVAAKEPMLPSTELQEWGNDVVLGQDIVLAKILPMQPSSVFVGDMKAQIGEFRDSLSCAKIGSIAEPFEIIPFHVEKFWDIMEEDGDNFKWARSEPLIENPAEKGYNDNLPWSDTVNGEKIKRIRRMNFYVMLPSEIAAGTSVPYIFSFKSTSYREGKKMFSQMYMRNRRANLPPPGFLFKISGIKTKNEKGTFIVPTVELSRQATQAEIAECLNWYKMIKKGGVKVDDSDLGSVDTAEVMAEGGDTGTGAF